MRELRKELVEGLVAAIGIVLGLTKGFSEFVPAKWDWTAGGTIALAVVTVGLIVAGRAESRERLTEDRRRAYRAALLEQMENCGLWVRWDPLRGAKNAAAHLVGRPPNFLAARDLVRSVDLPSDVTRVLVWLFRDAANRAENYQRCWLPYANVNQEMPGLCRDEWWVTADQLQALALLLVDHARTVPELAVVADAFDQQAMPWVRPVIGTPTERFDAHEQRRRFEQAPPWPAGDAYRRSSPQGRDEASNRARADQQASLTEAAELAGLRA